MTESMIIIPALEIIANELGYQSKFDILQIPGISFNRRHIEYWNTEFVDKHKKKLDQSIKELKTDNEEQKILLEIKSHLETPGKFHSWFLSYVKKLVNNDYITHRNRDQFNTMYQRTFGDKIDLIYEKLLIDNYIRNDDDSIEQYDLLNIASLSRREFINTKPYIKDSVRQQLIGLVPGIFYDIVVNYVFRWLGYNSKFYIIKETRRQFLAVNKDDLINNTIGNAVYYAIISGLVPQDYDKVITVLGYRHKFEILQIKREYFIKEHESDLTYQNTNGKFDKASIIYDSALDALSRKLTALGYNSGFDVIKTLRSQFVRNHNRDFESQAGFIYDLLENVASQEYSQYCDNRLHRNTQSRNLSRRDDSKKPTYLELFPDKWDEFSRSDSLEANDGIVAYLADLYSFAKKLDGNARSDAQTLLKRRPDLEDLLLDQKSRDEETGRLELVNEILSSAISKYLGGDATTDSPQDAKVEEAIAVAAYPFTLPLHHPWEKIVLGLSEQKISLREILKTVVLDISSNTNQNEKNEKILLADSELHPTQIILLTEKPASQERFMGFLSKYYGKNIPYRDFSAKFFLEQTKLTKREAEQLFCRGEFAPKKASYLIGKPTPKEYGAVYINSGEILDAIYINEINNQLSWAHQSKQRLDRIQRFIRLSRWSKLPYDKLDALIKTTTEGDIAVNISLDSLKTLGLFKYLDKKYSVSIDNFLACIGNISEYAVGETALPFLDQILNIPSFMSDDFEIDDKEFNYSVDEAQNLSCSTEMLPRDVKIINRLCAVFKINEVVFRVLAKQVQEAKKLPKNKLVLSLDVISALYRLVNVPRLLGLMTEVGMVLLQGIVVESRGDASNGLKILAENPSKSIVDVIIHLEKTIQHIAQLQIPIMNFVSLQMYTKIFSKFDSLSPEDTIYLGELRNQIMQGLQGTLLTEKSDVRITLKDQLKKILKDDQKVTAVLTELIDDKGLIKHIKPGFRKEKEDALKVKLKDLLKVDDEGEDFAILVALLSKMIEQQVNVILSPIVNKLMIQSQDVLQMFLLRWRRSSPYNIAAEAIKDVPTDDDGMELLKILWSVKYYEMIISFLKIDNDLLNILIECFIADPGYTMHEFTNDELIALKAYNEWFESGSAKEDDIWKYFTRVLFTEESDTIQSRLKTLATLINWDHIELCKVVSHLFGTNKEVKTPIQFGKVLQFKTLSDKTKVPVATLIRLSKLKYDSEFSKYYSVANSLLMNIHSQS